MIKRAIIDILLNGLALYLISYTLESVSYEGSWKFLLIGATVLGILNTIIKPILKFVTLPLIFFTAGLFLFVINGILIYLLKYILDVLDISGVSLNIVGFRSFLTAALLLGIINWVTHLFFKKD